MAAFGVFAWRRSDYTYGPRVSLGIANGPAEVEEPPPAYGCTYTGALLAQAWPVEPRRDGAKPVLFAVWRCELSGAGRCGFFETTTLRIFDFSAQKMHTREYFLGT